MATDTPPTAPQHATSNATADLYFPRHTNTQLRYTNYRPHQIVTAKDLNYDIRYFQNKLRRHNQFLVGYGIIYGAEVAITSKEITVSRGFVVTPSGDEIFIEKTVYLYPRSAGDEAQFHEIDADSQARSDIILPGGSWCLTVAWLTKPLYSETESEEEDDFNGSIIARQESYCFYLRKEWKPSQFPQELLLAEFADKKKAKKLPSKSSHLLIDTSKVQAHIDNS
jgi:hypothetical protein